VANWQSKISKSGWYSPRCYETHPGLMINGRLVYGGSCAHPVIDDADIYIGLDHSMKDHEHRLPWVDGHAIHYRITDMQEPHCPDEFALLIEWLARRIEKGDKVHIGCIGGHGRTGTVLAALVAYMTDEADAVKYVRDNYCRKAVESAAQISFLETHFGVITECQPSKKVRQSPFGVRDDWRYTIDDDDDNEQFLLLLDGIEDKESDQD
jgi:protein-tyrosine phosphatase